MCLFTFHIVRRLLLVNRKIFKQRIWKCWGFSDPWCWQNNCIHTCRSPYASSSFFYVYLTVKLYYITLLQPRCLENWDCDCGLSQLEALWSPLKKEEWSPDTTTLTSIIENRTWKSIASYTSIFTTTHMPNLTRPHSDEAICKAWKPHPGKQFCLTACTFCKTIKACNNLPNTIVPNSDTSKYHNCFVSPRFD